MEDPSASGWRLLKANVSLNTSKDSEEPWTTYPTEMIVAAQLLELIERESARRFVVHCGQKSGLLVSAFSQPKLIIPNRFPALGLQSGSAILQFQLWSQRE
jgi:hypothetical protein